MCSPSERIRRVNEHDVRIARQSQMLETIVQDEPFDAMPREDFAIPIAVRAYSDLYFSRKAFAQQRNFVALRLSVLTGIGSAVSSRQNRRSLPFRASRSAIHKTMGVFPVPPTVRLPTLITVPGNRRVLKIPRV